jgi:hypothetical protein
MTRSLLPEERCGRWLPKAHGYCLRRRGHKPYCQATKAVEGDGRTATLMPADKLASATIFAMLRYGLDFQPGPTYNRVIKRMEARL